MNSVILKNLKLLLGQQSFISFSLNSFDVEAHHPILFTECELEIFTVSRHAIIPCHQVPFNAYGTPIVHDASQIKQKTTHMIFRHIFWIGMSFLLEGTFKLLYPPRDLMRYDARSRQVCLWHSRYLSSLLAFGMWNISQLIWMGMMRVCLKYAHSRSLALEFKNKKGRDLMLNMLHF